MTKKLKNVKLRHNEYYDRQDVFDGLYQSSAEGSNFKNLMRHITCENNIMLAYRNIKKNAGSNTMGTDSMAIKDIERMEVSEFVQTIQLKFANYQPKPVKRVEIPKEGSDKTRPLGIPTMFDRLIQQCILQVMEPICEAKFYKHSYGFRPNRGAENAIAECYRFMQLSNLHYCVDIDIKGFFDNVNHGKLLKQIWTMGIRDKRLLSVLSKMLKAEIQGEGIPQRGVPQGGILSPLLSNIVLNELDWWISSQWETFPTRTKYSADQSRYPSLRRTSHMKEVFIVRYADDFRLFCKKRSDADNIFAATKLWLKERLDLEINEGKSRVVNLKKQYSEFLGFKMKLRRKSNKWVIKSHMTDKAIDKCKAKIREQIHLIGETPTQMSVMSFNAAILGFHNYYKCATNVYLDFDRIAFDVRKTLLCRTKNHRSKHGQRSKAFEQFYGDFTGKILNVCKIALFPVNGVKTVPPMCFPPDVCNYTEKGRAKIHALQKAVDPAILEQLMRNPIAERSAELNDNRISLYVAQRGRCAITGQPLQFGNMEVHHVTPISMGGKDNYNNLALLVYDAHKLVHAVNEDTIDTYMSNVQSFNLNTQRLNKMRKCVGLSEISTNR